MSVAKHLVWASGANEIDRVGPTAEKQLAGWTNEHPPYQWFNWYMNKVDQRLAALEDPFEIECMISHPNTRQETIAVGEDFVLPHSYVVGGNKLRVFLEGLLTYAGEEHTYVEVGDPGELSNIIRFNDAIPPEYSLRIEIPIRARDNIAVLDDQGLLSQESVTAMVGQAIRESHLRADIPFGRNTSLPNTRNVRYTSGDLYAVPTYAVGTGTLLVYVNGALCTPGIDYQETGISGETSTNIIWERTVDMTATIDIIAHAVAARLSAE